MAKRKTGFHIIRIITTIISLSVFIGFASNQLGSVSASKNEKTQLILELSEPQTYMDSLTVLITNKVWIIITVV